MNKVNINVTKQEKIDNRVNNTGRPVNKKISTSNTFSQASVI